MVPWKCYQLIAHELDIRPQLTERQFVSFLDVPHIIFLSQRCGRSIIIFGEAISIFR